MTLTYTVSESWLTPALFPVAVKKKASVTQTVVAALWTVDAHMLTAAIVNSALIKV